MKKRIKNSPENILIFPDTHEAIIDRKTFALVQKHFEGRKRPDKQGEIDKYAGILYCGECGSRPYLHRAKTMKPELNNFMCGGYQSQKTDCTSHYILPSHVLAMTGLALGILSRVHYKVRSFGLAPILLPIGALLLQLVVLAICFDANPTISLA